jgi:hypothetical protein
MQGEWKKQRWLLISVLMLLIYTLSAWWNWFFGGGFSGRAFSQEMAWLSIPVASLVTWLFSWCNKGNLQRVVTYVFFVVVFLGISLNLGQTNQYLQSYIHFDSMSKKAYFHTFGRYVLFGEEGEKLWGILDYLDNEKMKSGEQRDQ